MGAVLDPVPGNIEGVVISTMLLYKSWDSETHSICLRWVKRIGLVTMHLVSLTSKKEEILGVEKDLFS